MSVNLLFVFDLNLLDSVQSAQLLSENNRVVDVFVVSDAETKAPIPEEKWPHIEQKIISKLKRRNVLNSTSGDPSLVEQVNILSTASVEFLGAGICGGESRLLLGCLVSVFSRIVRCRGYW